jgi:hypothetical protein
MAALGEMQHSSSWTRNVTSCKLINSWISASFYIPSSLYICTTVLVTSTTRSFQTLLILALLLALQDGLESPAFVVAGQYNQGGSRRDRR